MVKPVLILIGAMFVISIVFQEKVETPAYTNIDTTETVVPTISSEIYSPTQEVYVEQSKHRNTEVDREELREERLFIQEYGDEYLAEGMTREEWVDAVDFAETQTQE